MMEQFRLKLLLAAAMLVLAGFGCDKSTRVSDRASRETVETRRAVSQRDEVIATRFVREKEFTDTELVDVEVVDGYPVAGIVNHHALAMDLQARFFKSLKESRPDIERFVVISPDHFLSGDLVSTHGYAYATPAGEVESRALGVKGIFEAKDVKLFEGEHGVGTLAPFIAREFPRARLVPVYIRPEAAKSRLEKLGVSIAELVDEETFVILSSDMSHYLKDDEARENDKVTLSWIEEPDWEKLQSADDDYTDSAQGFVVLESLFTSLKQEVSFQLLDHVISTDYGADPNETTSYINGFYFIADSR
ncbi:AmmeMemoRadiSam system protein B [Candidatus Uhrbacteria bacterium]|nr:AmmeMemoRadiSam system protein B [Candidatus Uhrbacteria bacterium]